MRVPIQSQPEPAPVPQKRRHGLRAFIIILAVFIVLAVGVSATGLVNVPLVSSVIGSNQPRDLGVKASPEALASIQKDMPVKILGGPSGLCLGCAQTYEGEIAITARRTSEEMTSFLQLFPRESNDILKNTQVRYIEGGLEISTRLKKYVSAPVYVKVMVTRTSAKSVALDIVDGKVGLFKVPEQYRKKAEEFFTKLINEHLADVQGFSMDKLEFHSGYSDFAGTYPAVVKPAPGNWTSVF